MLEFVDAGGKYASILIEDLVVKLVILVRADLAMGRGKLAAQVAHAAVHAVLDRLDTPDCTTWLQDGQPKIVLKVADEDELRRITKAAKRAALPAILVSDAGRTQLPFGTATCGAIGPAEDHRIDALTGDLSLL
jgi:peptidyl-tRNA hydrolase, PTH2 family